MTESKMIDHEGPYTDDSDNENSKEKTKMQRVKGLPHHPQKQEGLRLGLIFLFWSLPRSQFWELDDITK